MIKEVQVIKEVGVPVEVVREVPVIKEVEVVKTIEVEVPKIEYRDREVIKEVCPCLCMPEIVLCIFLNRQRLCCVYF